MSALSRRWKGDTTSRQGGGAFFKRVLALEKILVKAEERKCYHFGSNNPVLS